MKKIDYERDTEIYTAVISGASAFVGMVFAVLTYWSMI